jgi:type IV pilus assembly protein PilQ
MLHGVKPLTFAALAIVSVACAPAVQEPAVSRPIEAPAWAEGTAPSVERAPVTQAPKQTISLGTESTAPVFRGKRIDLDLVAADLPNVCRLIGELAGVNVVVADGVAGTVTVKMKGVPWEDALDAILLSKGYVKERVRSVIVVRGH